MFKKLTAEEFFGIVQDELESFVVNKDSFTSWDITEALRKKNPDTYIPHLPEHDANFYIVENGVRNIVHDLMEDKILNGLNFDFRNENYVQPNGTIQVARTYYKQSNFAIQGNVAPPQLAPKPNTPNQLPSGRLPDWD